jgi:hypothetical protein
MESIEIRNVRCPKCNNLDCFKRNVKALCLYCTKCGTHFEYDFKLVENKEITMKYFQELERKINELWDREDELIEENERLKREIKHLYNSRCKE